MCVRVFTRFDACINDSLYEKTWKSLESWTFQVFNWQFYSLSRLELDGVKGNRATAVTFVRHIRQRNIFATSAAEIVRSQ